MPRRHRAVTVSFGCVVLAASVAGAAPPLVRDTPYIQNATPTSAVGAWFVLSSPR